ncbi:hypothetical protein H5S09_02765 [Limosilactobacillus sp. STM2_1]|uniref:Phage protein n=1 Tax=Limosilactobacillus rudii TaxID=2759755 RepID=A0A7W3YN21_9LACO|nr:hypothetical protein [Limosilactobacillus rudii]MBB1080224.1 hypothetical protein [Limosilactobacillus rudii]MBB1096872.1 hypothetical protein [Limosilactobacillus rudii]MCD7133770.1 PGDYG domain-containing protein [Limosilactobacillus rudii]
MLHKYRKTATIQAEQFDGSDEMIEKYDIEASVTIFISQYILHTKEGPMYVHIGDYIATGVEGEHWAIAPDIFEKTYERCD